MKIILAFIYIFIIPFGLNVKGQTNCHDPYLCLNCIEYKSNCVEGKIIQNTLVSFEDTSIAYISGKIVDYANNPVHFAMVVLKSLKSNHKNIIYVNEEGKYEVTISKGEYEFQAYHFKSKPIIIPSIILNEGDKRLIDVNIGENCCLKAKNTINLNLSDSQYVVEYYSNFKTCGVFYQIDDSFSPPTRYFYADSTVYYWNSKQRKSIFTYKNCLKEGKWITWGVDGKVTSIQYYNSGKETGLWKSWDFRGLLCEVTKYNNGEMIKTSKIAKNMSSPGIEANSIDVKSNGAMKVININTYTRKIITRHYSKKGFEIKRTEKWLDEGVGLWGYKINDSGDLIRKKSNEE